MNFEPTRDDLAMSAVRYHEQWSRIDLTQCKRKHIIKEWTHRKSTSTALIELIRELHKMKEDKVYMDVYEGLWNDAPSRFRLMDMFYGVDR